MYVIDSDHEYKYRVDFNSLVNPDDPDRSYIIWDLTLLAGKEYIAPDYTDDQGWVTADAFNDDIQIEIVTQRIKDESLTEMLESEGYEILKGGVSAYKYGVYPYQKVEL